jgi:hypothetical protein
VPLQPPQIGPRSSSSYRLSFCLYFHVYISNKIVVQQLRRLEDYTTHARARSLINSSGVYAQNGIKADFLGVLLFPLTILNPPTALYSLVILSPTL